MVASGVPGTKSAQRLLGSHRPTPLSCHQKGVGGVHDGTAPVGAGRCRCRRGPCQSAAPRSHRQDSARPEAGPGCRQVSAPAAAQGEAGAVHSCLPPSTSSAAWPDHQAMKLVHAAEEESGSPGRVSGAAACVGHGGCCRAPAAPRGSLLSPPAWTRSLKSSTGKECRAASLGVRGGD